MKVRALVICDLGFASPYWPKFCEYLGSKHGWDVTVLTPSMSKSQKRFFNIDKENTRSYRIHETSGFKMEYRRTAGYSRIRRLVDRFVNAFIYKYRHRKNSVIVGLIDSHELWIKFAVQSATKEHIERPFNLIISSCLPFSTHVIGSQLQKLFNIPWIADFRDPFSYSHTNISAPDPARVSLETRVLSNASLCTTTSLGFSAAIRKTFPGPIEVIHNGFDELQPIRSSKFGDRILITYQGSIYRKFQRIEILLDALDQHYARQANTQQIRKPITLRIGGYSTHLVTEYYRAKSREIPEWVEVIGVTSYQQTLKLQMESDFLLMLNWEDGSQSGVMQTKLYEYISSGTRVIATGGYLDESSRILNSSRTSTFYKSSQELADFLDLVSISEELAIIRDDEFLHQFSRRNQASILNKLALSLLKP